VAEEHDDQTDQPTKEPAKAAPPPEEPDEHPVREAVAKAVGIAVEAGSMLAGQSGELVSAEGAMAEADTEEFIDRIDGED